MLARFGRLVVVAAVAVAVVGGLAAPISPGSRSARAVDDVTIDVLVLDGRGDPLRGAVVTAGSETAVTDGYGRVRLFTASAPPVVVVAHHPLIGSTRARWSGRRDLLVMTVARPIVRALHVHGTVVGSARWDELLAIAERTAVNGFVLDLKDESGRVFPATSSSTAHTAGSAVGAWDLAEVVADLHGRGLAMIVRIVTFQDPVVGNAIPGLAARLISTGEPFTRRGLTFLDPTDPEARDYALELAEEACRAGVDEVQFDYVRFPDGFRGVAEFDGATDEQSRVDTIVGFLAEADDRLGGSCAVAADVFGLVTSVPGDGGIGQRLEDLAPVTGVVSPMVYPNHWSAGWFGFDVPAEHPGPVAYESSVNAIVRIGGSGVAIRPWLQDFGGYRPEEVRAQITAADSLGLGWMLWNAVSTFTTEAIPTEAELATPTEPTAPYERNRPRSGFWDVADTTRFAADVAWLAGEEITRGCNPPWGDHFCPDRALTRAEAAALLARALDLPAGPADRFVDDDDSVHEADVERLAGAGITMGCGPVAFCPDRALTRAEAAALLARALDLPAGPADRFVDDDDSVHEDDVERLAGAGITMGCGPVTFCPEQPLPREQVAAFLHRALG